MSQILFAPGDCVRVRSENFTSRWVKPHLRTPGYLFSQSGRVERICGLFENPETAAYRSDGIKQPLYRVRFLQKDLWPEYEGSQKDTIDVEIYQHWLVLPEGPVPEPEANCSFNPLSEHSHDHLNEHEHDHVHEQRLEVEQRAVDQEGAPGSVQNLAEILLSILLDKAILTKEELRLKIEERELHGIQLRGADVIARAWMDQDFKERLLENANKALLELGIEVEPQMIVVENTEDIHNVIVCTLCSCYPRQLLGMPPDWYKSRSYRARLPREPRKVLQEFGTDISQDTLVRVHDSTADMRYMVLPQRPPSTEDFTFPQLVSLVHRDSLIGVTRTLSSRQE